jgi:hypothetical protein
MIASTPFRPTLLLPAAHLLLLSATDCVRFHVIAYNSAEEAWQIADNQRVHIFVSQPSPNSVVDNAVVAGILALQPNIAHIHIFESISEVIELVNKSSLIRLVASHEVSSLLESCCLELAQVLQSRQATLNDLERLREENEQYEFMLRQSLLS